MNKNCFVLILLLAFFDFSLSFAKVGMPVKARLMGKPHPAIAGEVFKAGIKITVGIEAELSNFHIGEEGWSPISLDAPPTVHLLEMESIVIDFEALPIDPKKPLIFYFDMNGQEVRKAYNLSKERYDRLMNPPRVTSVPGSESLPFPGVDRSRADPGYGDEESVFRQILEELKGMRRSINVLKQKMTDTQKMIEKYHPDTSESLVTVSIDDDHMLGDETAPVTIIEFSDYRCSICRKFFKEIFPGLKTDYIDTGKARYVFRDFPLSLQSQARIPARVANCAGKQGKYWQMHDLLFESQMSLKNKLWEDFAEQIGLNKNRFKTCMNDKAIDAEIEKDREDGVTAKVTATPSFIIGKTTKSGVVEGELIKGIQSIEFFKAKINELLTRQ